MEKQSPSCCSLISISISRAYLFYAALPLIPRSILGSFFHTYVYNYILRQQWDILHYNAVIPFFLHLYVRRAIYVFYPIEVLFTLIAAPTHISYNIFNFFEYREWNPE